MSALLVVIGLLLGTAAPASLAAVTTLQWAELGLIVGNDAIKLAPRALRDERALVQFLQSPAFRLMLARNGDAAIRWQERQMEN